MISPGALGGDLKISSGKELPPRTSEALQKTSSGFMALLIAPEYPGLADAYRNRNNDVVRLR
jgi:hypothetical protein